MPELDAIDFELDESRTREMRSAGEGAANGHSVRRVLVTGGAGFIGSHVVDVLVARGCEVRVLDNLIRGNKLSRSAISRVDLVAGDLLDRELVLKVAEGVDTIFHLAAVLGVEVVADNPAHTMLTEILGAENVIRAATVQRAKIIFASTSSIYGPTEKPAAEDEAVGPVSGYAVAKRYVEAYLEAIHKTTGLESVSLRYFNVYGPRQDDRMVIPRFIQRALKGESLVVFAEGKQTRDFTFVTEVAEATVALAEKVSGCEIVNISSGRETTIRDLAELILDTLGLDGHLALEGIPIRRVEYESMRRCGSQAKLERLLGRAPSKRISEGIAESCAHLLRSSEQYRKAYEARRRTSVAGGTSVAVSEAADVARAG